MKLLDSYIKKEIKKAIKDNKSPIIFGLIMSTMINAGSIFTVNENKRIEREKFVTKLVQDIEEGKEHDKFQEMVEKAAKSSLLEKTNKESNQVFYDTLPLEDNTSKEEKRLSAHVGNIVKNSSNYRITQVRDFNINNIDEGKIELLANRFKEYWDNTENSMSKKDLLNAIVDGTIKEMIDTNILAVNDTLEEKIDTNNLSSNNVAYEKIDTNSLSSNNTVKREVKEITIDEVDFYSEQEKFDYICNKYNLTEFELKVVISVIYHEAAWTYDDAYRVTNVIYNRTKSKEMVRYIGYLTGIDGKSLYAQVIATSYGKDGTAYQQFSGYLPSVAGYDYEKLLEKDPDRVRLNGIFDFLISEDCVHSFYSFKSSSHSSNDWEGATDWIRYTDNGNVYHDMLQEDDLNDENYVIIPVERNVLVRKRG